MKNTTSSLHVSHYLPQSKMGKLLATLSLFLALNSVSSSSLAQSNDKKTTSVEVEKQNQISTVKDKYLIQLLAEIEKEMKQEEEQKQLEKNKEVAKSFMRDLSQQTFFQKEKKELLLDDYLSKFDISSVESSAKLISLIGKLQDFLASLKQKTVLIGNEKVSTGSEISPDEVDTFLARLLALKKTVLEGVTTKPIDVLISPEIRSVVAEAKSAIQLKETQYKQQNHIVDSLKKDYTNHIQSIYDLDGSANTLSSEIAGKELEKSAKENEFSTLSHLGEKINKEDFITKVTIQKTVETLKQNLVILADSLKNIQAELIVKNNATPVKKNAIDQANEKQGTIQTEFLNEQKKRYEIITKALKETYKGSIATQDAVVAAQMDVLKKSIEKSKNGIDSLNVVLKKINEQLVANQSGNHENGEIVIEQRENDIKNLLKEYVKFAYELNQSYAIYKENLEQNRQAIIELEANNPFIKTDVSELDQIIKETKRMIDAKKVAIAAKEKEKIETADNQKVMLLIDQLSLLYQDLQDLETSYTESQQLYDQRVAFDKEYSQNKNQELQRIDEVLDYLKNNISSITYGKEAFVYTYTMQNKKIQIQNLETKLSAAQKTIADKTKELEEQQRQFDLKNAEVGKTTGEPRERLPKEKAIRVKINEITSNILSLKKLLNETNKKSKEYETQLIALKDEFRMLASLDNDALISYFGYMFNEKQLKANLTKNTFFYQDKNLTIRGSESVPNLLDELKIAHGLIKESGLEPVFTLDQVNLLLK